MALFPLFYAGNIEYYRALLDADRVVFEMHEHFHKQTFRNRMEMADVMLRITTGCRVEVFWSEDNCYYRGTITKQRDSIIQAKNLSKGPPRESCLDWDRGVFRILERRFWCLCSPWLRKETRHLRD